MSGATSDIVVTAFSPRFGAAFARLIRVEGGFVNASGDKGGTTKYGISLRFLAAQGKIDPVVRREFDLDLDGQIGAGDIRALQLPDAKLLYWRCFWVADRCEAYPCPIGEALFDQAVNCGSAAAARELQNAINAVSPMKIPVDGNIGPRTNTALIGAMSRAGTARLIAAFRAAAADRYRGIVAADPSQRKFLPGWLNRAAELGTV